jgi:hypothetical protein
MEMLPTPLNIDAWCNAYAKHLVNKLSPGITDKSSVKRTWVMTIEGETKKLVTAIKEELKVKIEFKNVRLDSLGVERAESAEVLIECFENANDVDINQRQKDLDLAK